MAEVIGLFKRIQRLKKVYVVFALSIAIVFCVLCLRGARGGRCERRVDASGLGFVNLRIDSSIVADGVVESLLKPYRDSVAIKMSRRLCFCDEEMVAKRPESNLTRFLADLFLSEVRTQVSQEGLPEPDFALLNVGGMRCALPKGELRLANVFQLAPFENSAVVLTLDSAVVYELFQHIAERGGEAISGASFVISQDGHAETIAVNGKPLDGSVTYRLATLDYLATGGDDFECLVGEKVCYQGGCALRDLITDYLVRMGESGEHAKAPANTRISVSNK